MAEPTSALTFDDLIVEVARKLGVAYYGAAGDEVAQAPVDVHDLAEVKNHVNNGIRMFISDAPANGWRWMRPTLDVALWGSVVEDDDVTVTSAFDGTLTTITASEDTFFSSMEEKTITVTDVGDLTINKYVSATAVTIPGDVSWVGAKTFSITADGGYTLPQTFGGQYTGPVNYAAATNLGATIEWTHEAQIRQLRENVTVHTGYPRFAAVRLTPGLRRRWELAVFPTPDASWSVEFQYDLFFDHLTDPTDVHPAGYQFDEAVKAACFAVMERDGEDQMAGLMTYYREIALPNAYRIDGRSAPPRLGYVGNPGQRRRSLRNFRDFIQRPNVTYNSP